MRLKMWTYDLAREQSPTIDHLYQMAALTQDAGFNALGLYLEHRFAYPSAPWAHGKGCLTPDMVRRVRAEFPSLQLIPFINLLGHFEGMLYTEHGKRYREELFNGLQACPAMDEFVSLCRKLIDDTCDAFDSDLIHIGGDETYQLGASAASQARIDALRQEHAENAPLWPEGVLVDSDLCTEESRRAEIAEGLDGKALLYGAHFGPLAHYVLEKGRRPGVWGDMFRERPQALDLMPKETLIFEWQYFKGVRETAQQFVDKGFEVVGCPALHTYNATWLHVEQSEQNVREVTDDARAMGLEGVCVTTWECGLFGAYDTLFPALRACGSALNGGEGSFYAHYRRESERHEEWARLMSEELGGVGGIFKPGQNRSELKCRLLLYGNPFLLWLHHGEELSGPVGEMALNIAQRAMVAAPGEAYKGPAVLLKSAVEFAQLAEEARLEYAYGRPEAAVSKLAHSRALFDDLRKTAKWNHERIGGSLADIERCRVAKEWIERVMQRLRNHGDGQLGYLPAWEVITHPKFMPHDQGCWWLINKWANQ